MLALIRVSAGLPRLQRHAKSHLKSWIKSRKFQGKCSVPAGASGLIVRSLHDQSGAIFLIRDAA